MMNKDAISMRSITAVIPRYFYILLYRVIIIISIMCSISANNNLINLEQLLKEANISSTIVIHSNNTKEFGNSVKVANQRCQSFCPDVVIKPRTAQDVSAVVKLVQHNNLISQNTNELIHLSIRGGGHSYTCQSVKEGGILLDMRNFNHIIINDDTIKVGAGLTFKDIFKILDTNKRSIIHGQCLNVGVVGYTIHGGVHFGALSNIYGLGSDNLVGVQMIVSNGSIIDIFTKNNDNSIECMIDKAIGDIHECSRLMQGMRGAGSSLGVVTLIDLRLVKTSHVRTALTILSIEISDVVSAERAFQNYLSNFLSEMSVTFFGLDDFFKAYFFVIKFAKNRFDAWTQNRFTNNFKRYKNTRIHFVIEVSWIDNDQFKLNELHPFLEEFHNIYQQSQGLELRPFFITSGPWSVDSYDLVWGSGHFYSGASITVDKKYAENILQTLFESFRQLKSKKYCSDCVVVIHRVGEGLKKAFNTNSSFNSFIQSSHLWVEMDCGHFFRRQILKNDWINCTHFVDNVQTNLDRCTRNDSRMHYPNVPNLVTEDWHVQYYGIKAYHKLQKLKLLWDPNDVFNHAQSIKPFSNSTYINNNSYIKEVYNNNKCLKIYHNHGLSDFKNIFRVIFGISTFSFIINRVKSVLLKITTSAIKI